MLRAIAVLLLLSGPAFVDSLTAFMRAPEERLDATIQNLTAALGEPSEISFSLVQNIHDPKMRDVRATLGYPEGQVTVYFALCCNTSFLERLRVNDPRWAEKLGVRWPRDAEDVRRRFGKPLRETPREIRYEVENEIGSGIVTFGLDRRLVKWVEWEYPID
jgi:hypothetical protein